jgi:hypothetical protein
MTILPFGLSICIECKAPVAIVRRTVELPCRWCSFHTTDNCQCAKDHTHAVPDCLWTVVDEQGERHECAA